MVLLKELKLIFYAVFLGLFFSLLIVFYNPLGIAQIIMILANLSLCVVFYGLFKIILNRISFHSKIRDIYRTNKKLVVTITEEDNNLKQKRIWHYDTIFLTKLLLGILLAFALSYPLIYFFTFIHELSHAIIALIYGVPVIDINISGAGIGYTEFYIITSDNVMGQIFLAGSLGAIIFGIAFLIVICRNKNMKLDGVISIYCLIGYVILTNVLYWRESVLLKEGDGWDFLTYNPQLDPFWLVNFCEILYWATLFCLILFLAAKTFTQLSSFLKKFFPDLSIYDVEK